MSPAGISPDAIATISTAANLFFLYITLKVLLTIVNGDLRSEVRACGLRYSPMEFILLVSVELPLFLVLAWTGDYISVRVSDLGVSFGNYTPVLLALLLILPLFIHTVPVQLSAFTSLTVLQLIYLASSDLPHVLSLPLLYLASLLIPVFSVIVLNTKMVYNWALITFDRSDLPEIVDLLDSMLLGTGFSKIERPVMGYLAGSSFHIFPTRYEAAYKLTKRAFPFNLVYPFLCRDRLIGLAGDMIPFKARGRLASILELHFLNRLLLEVDVRVIGGIGLISVFERTSTRVFISGSSFKLFKRLEQALSNIGVPYKSAIVVKDSYVENGQEIPRDEIAYSSDPDVEAAALRWYESRFYGLVDQIRGSPLYKLIIGVISFLITVMGLIG